MFAIGPLEPNDDASDFNKNLLNTGRLCRTHNVVRALAECAIRMRHAVRMDVRELDCGAEKKQDREECDEQNADVRIARPSFACSSHN